MITITSEARGGQEKIDELRLANKWLRRMCENERLIAIEARSKETCRDASGRDTRSSESPYPGKNTAYATDRASATSSRENRIVVDEADRRWVVVVDGKRAC